MRKKIEDPLISVIVPIYNVEAYLPRCIGSILKQTYKNLEIILVDDGSTDGCGKICDDYAKEDKRIKVIHKSNGGLSDARNVGLDNMTGLYVTCIDSDDFVSAFYISNLWTALRDSKSDIASSWFVEYYEGDTISPIEEAHIEKKEILSKEEYFKRLLYQDGVEISAWGKLYRSTLFSDIRYPMGRLYEDIPTTYLLIEKAQRMTVISNIDYYYFQRKNSIAQEKFSVRKMDAINNMHVFGSFIKETYPELVNAFECRYFSTVCNILFQIGKGEFDKQKKELWNEVKKYRCCVLKNPEARMKSRLAAMISYGGYRLMKKIYRWNEKTTYKKE